MDRLTCSGRFSESQDQDTGGKSLLPGLPWLGVLLEPGLLPGSPAMKWLVDFMKCLSWSVLDRALSRANPNAGWVN